MTSEVGSQFAHQRGLPSLPYELPAAEEAASGKRARSAWGPIAGLIMYALSVAMVVKNDAFRQAEVHIAAPVSAFVTGSHRTVFIQSSVYFHLGSPRGFGLNLTTECTSALLLIPLFVMMGSFAIFTSLSLRRELLAVACGAALILAVNSLRIAGIAFATWHWGVPGYDYSHVFVGSAFSLVGFVGAMLIALWILVRTERMKQAVVVIKRAWWVATAPAGHRVASGARGMLRGRPDPAHLYRRRRR